MNNPELTVEKFDHDLWDYPDHLDKENKSFCGGPGGSFFKKRPLVAKGKEVYKTGDLARWLPDGNIEFLGRIDHQVKIRGFRIELGEIENHLLGYEQIKAAVAAVVEDKQGDKALVAYFISDNELPGNELREYLSTFLPDYMIPFYFVYLEKMPLTPTGKIDRKALPTPGIKAGKDYMAPRNRVEEKLAEIWGQVLGIEKSAIGINANFFELGGQSLKATIMLSKIHKELDAKVSLTEIFKTSTIRGLAEYIKGTAEDRYVSIEPLEKKEYYELSSAQQRLFILQQMEPESTAYNMPRLIPLGEEPQLARLEQTFIQLIRRHESFRTSFHMIEESPVQKVHDHVEFGIEYDEPGSTTSLSLTPGKMLNDFVRFFDLARVPLLRVALIKSGNREHLLVIDMHHIISDGVSRMILEQDFITLYEGRTLAPLRIQYKDFSQWQNSEGEKENLKRQEGYWLKGFEGEIPVLNLPTDYPRPAVQSFAGAVVVFEICADETRALKAMALGQGSTLFMVLLALTDVLISRLSSQEDIVIGTPIAGRRHADLEKTMGMFINTLALRNYPSGEKSFRGFLREVRDRTLEAFENQDYQFEDLVEQAAVRRDASRNPIFDVMLVLNNMNIGSGGTRGGAVPGALQDEFERSTAKFDLTLAASEDNRAIFFAFQYCSKLFKKETIERFIRYFKNILSSVIADPGKKMCEIEIISREEKKQLLLDFNDTAAGFPTGKTLHELFEKQVEKTPDRIAAVGNKETNREPIQITYRQLDEQSNGLASYLRDKGVTPDSIVGIMVERSIEMITGILGILKAGGCYLPIEPGYPEDRINYMLADSASEILVTTQDYSKEIKFDKKIILISEAINRVPTPPHLHLSPWVNAPVTSLAYTIYTSGSTGKPKGV
ncbi:MAG: condensation domain-containing protein, partial [bacterium]